MSRKVRFLSVVAMLSAVAFVLMLLDFSVPFLMPGFVKLDFSELPALLAAFSLGPLAGVAVCLIKNLLHLFITSTVGAGELCNFLLGVCFVLPAGLIYKRKKNKKTAILGALLGALCMALASIPINGFIIYPMYMKLFHMELGDIVGAYSAIYPKINAYWACMILISAPFNLLKCVCNVILCTLIYKPLSPILKGRG